MSAEQNHESAPRIVLRDHAGIHTQSLDTNHDGNVSMAEMNPPRAEDGHDLAVTGVAALALTAAFIAAATIEGGRRAKRFFSVRDTDPGADAGPSVEPGSRR